MEVTYYPGCSLTATARDYDESIRAVCKALDVDLKELADWTCCGATSAHAINDRLSVLLPASNLPAAEKAGLPVVVPCPLCFNRLKRSQKEVGSTIGVHDLTSFLAQPELLDKTRERVANKLSGISVVCYYGCMANRPPKELDSKSYENPTDMDEILAACGVKVAPWSYKTDCCGASFALSRRDIVLTLVKKLYDKAIEAGADAIAVSCQMCQANLDMYQDAINEQFGAAYDIPIFYVTELMTMALGIDQPGSFLARHLKDPRPFLADRGML